MVVASILLAMVLNVAVSQHFKRNYIQAFDEVFTLSARAVIAYCVTAEMHKRVNPLASCMAFHWLPVWLAVGKAGKLADAPPAGRTLVTIIVRC